MAPQWVVEGFNFPADVEVIYCDDFNEPTAEQFARVDYAIIPYLSSVDEIASAIPKMPKLKVLQTITAGFDSVLPLMPPGVTLCNAPGVHNDSTSEMALTLTLSVLREIPRLVRRQDQHEWSAFFSTSLADKQVLLIGYGEVGKAIEKRLLPFGCEVTVVASTARDNVKGISQLPELIPNADVVILIVPLNDQTLGLVDAEFISKMKHGALLVNMARGKVVDTDALVAALYDGKIRAGLDVTNPEPLPADHPLWDAPNCLITAHLGGDTDVFYPRAISRIHRQLELWTSGRELECVITG